MRRSVDKILDIIISEHGANTISSNVHAHNMDFVDTLLSFMGKPTDRYDELSHVIDPESIKAIMVDMIAAGIDTSHTAIEWIMTELIRHPKSMQKLQDEIKSIIGDNEMVEESDLVKFHYLDMVIKEGLRLHPVVPLLIPRQSMQDVEINGYHIPKASRVYVNSWALGRDPDFWSSENVEEFIPERFVDKDVDYKGLDYGFLPFGSGRRICPGMYLGLVYVKQVVAQLVHSFDWELPNGMSVNDISLDERFGLTMPRKESLCAVPRVRG